MLKSGKEPRIWRCTFKDGFFYVNGSQITNRPFTYLNTSLRVPDTDHQRYVETVWDRYSRQSFCTASDSLELEVEKSEQHSKKKGTENYTHTIIPYFVLSQYSARFA